MVEFGRIKPQNFWYIIGFIATDGYLSKDGRHINITSKDKKHLFAIREALGIENKIGNKYRSISRDKTYFQIQFGDVRFYKHLLGIGFVQKKSLNLCRLKVDPRYFKDFLRGIIDGDGCISTWIHKSNLHRQWSLRISSAAPLFIKWLKEEVEKYFDVRGRLHKDKRKNKEHFIYILKFGKLAAKIILKQIYYKNALSLVRKNLKSTACLQDRNKMIIYKNILSPGAGTGRQRRLKIC